jgi:NAD(P)-dependent dehydrogenase (short-subunit alcohol dehydrogenase family)
LALANAVVPEMMLQSWGWIVNVTTSLGTMINAGYPTYGPSKAALEALSAIMAKDLDGAAGGCRPVHCWAGQERARDLRARQSLHGAPASVAPVWRNLSD